MQIPLSLFIEYTDNIAGPADNHLKRRLKKRNDQSCVWPQKQDITIKKKCQYIQ